MVLYWKKNFIETNLHLICCNVCKVKSILNTEKQIFTNNATFLANSFGPLCTIQSGFLFNISFQLIKKLNMADFCDRWSKLMLYFHKQTNFYNLNFWRWRAVARLGGIGIIGRIVHLLSPDTLQLLELSSAVTLQIQHFKLHWNLFTVNTDRVNLEQERSFQTCKRCSNWRVQ